MSKGFSAFSLRDPAGRGVTGLERIHPIFMSAQPTPRPDPELSRLLRDWDVPDELPPRFNEGVWRRLESSSALRPDSTLLSRWRAWWHRPGMAWAYVAILLAAGASAGAWQGRVTALQVIDQLQGRYVLSVDPFAHFHGIPGR